MSKRYLIASISTFLLAIVLAISPIAAMTSQASSNSVSPFEVCLVEADSPYSLPKMNAIEGSGQGLSTYSSARSSLPLRYDLRDRGNVTSIKDQNLFGTCWAFAAIASFESALLEQGRASATNLDLSEMQLAYFTDWLANAGEADALGAPNQRHRRHHRGRGSIRQQIEKPCELCRERLVRISSDQLRVGPERHLVARSQPSD